jgi:hypothetical protein
MKPFNEKIMIRGGASGEVGSRRLIDLTVNVTEYVDGDRWIRYTRRRLIDN